LKRIFSISLKRWKMMFVASEKLNKINEKDKKFEDFVIITEYL